MTSCSRGYRSSSPVTGSGPVCSPASGPDPQWMTTGVPVSSSRAHTASSSGSRGSNAPTCTCTLNTRAPASSASAT